MAQCKPEELEDGSVMYVMRSGGDNTTSTEVDKEWAMSGQDTDIASGSFIGKWPTWLRWVLFAPASIAAALVFPILAAIFGGFDTAGSNASFVGSIISSIVFGWAFVYVAAFIAPKHQGVIAIIYSTLLAAFVGCILTLGLVFGRFTGLSAWLNALYLATSMAAGIVSAVIVKREL